MHLVVLNNFSVFSYKSKPTELRILKNKLKHSRDSLGFSKQSLRQIGQGIHELWTNIQKKTTTTIENNYFLKGQPALKNPLHLNLKDFLKVKMTRWSFQIWECYWSLWRQHPPPPCLFSVKRRGYLLDQTKLVIENIPLLAENFLNIRLQ